jgi:hypothetical protein
MQLTGSTQHAERACRALAAVLIQIDVVIVIPVARDTSGFGWRNRLTDNEVFQNSQGLPAGHQMSINHTSSNAWIRQISRSA